MITTSTPARWQASSAARLGQREAAVGVAEERGARAEQGAVEVGVDAAQCHRSGRYRSVDELAAGRPDASTSAQPLAAGIVNVTVDSMFEGARSGTPEQAVADGLALVEAGFDMLDVGAVAAKGGPPVPAEEEAAALVPAIEGWSRRGVPISADTFSVEVARRGAGGGGGRGQRHLRRLGGDVRAGRRERAAATC